MRKTRAGQYFCKNYFYLNQISLNEKHKKKDRANKCIKAINFKYQKTLKNNIPPYVFLYKCSNNCTSQEIYKKRTLYFLIQIY